MQLVLKALVELAKNWKGVLALCGLVATTGFSAKELLHGGADSALKLWPIAALACLLLLVREFMRGYFDLKREELHHRDKR